MTTEIQIRDVTVELLRSGPPHNQLLSPLTQYLGLCGDQGAGIVTVPYEHAKFRRRLRSMRYDSAEESDRLPVLREIGLEIANILGSIPGLPGALTSDPEKPAPLIHLRLVLSASELALLPFELTKVPIGPNSLTESWLALQVRVPVCITRRARNVTSQGVRLPTRPRILFVAGNPSDVPFEEHRAALLEAIKPFHYPGKDDPVVSEDKCREQYGTLLTIIKNACFDDIVKECGGAEYTHIHFLAHGDVDPLAPDTSYGLVLRTAGGDPDVISGERLASAIAILASGQIHRPTVVTLATCDSANIGSVEIPGASLAHALHQAGIPMVVASQFPLSKAGSISVVRTLYQGQLWGANPWILLHRIRTELHGRFVNSSHDWASLVVYEALPGNLGEQLEETTYYQSKRALDAALERVDLAVQEEGAKLDPAQHGQLEEGVRQACQHLPLEGRFAMECLGLRASSWKRLAQAEYNLASSAGAHSSEQLGHLRRCYELLDKALVDYRQAARGFLVNKGQPTQRIASLHWVLVQMLSLAAVTGKPVRDGSWEAARLSAEVYLDHRDLDEKAWAYGSLAELWFLRLADAALESEDRVYAAQQAIKHASELVNLYPWSEAFPITSTRKQFARYVEWWGQPVFENGLAEVGNSRRPSWTGRGGILETASEIIRILDRSSRSARDQKGAETPAPLEAEKNSAKPSAATPIRKALSAKKGVQSLRASPKNTPPGEPFFDIEMLPAGHGDCLWIQYGDRDTTSRILIDCGTESTYEELQKRVAQQPDAERNFELFILTHIDADHIGGAIPFFADRKLGVRFEDVWFNGWKHLPSGRLGAKQGEIFSTLIQDNKLPWNKWRDDGPIVVEGADLPMCKLPGGMQLTLLSPTQEKLMTLEARWKKEVEALGLRMGEADDFRKFLRATPSTSTDVDVLADSPFKADTAAPNASSIAVLAEYKGKSALLAADAHAPLLVTTIGRLLNQRGKKKLKLDAFKVSHHASQNNLNVELIKLLDCRNYLISTDGARFNHPDRETIGRIIKYGGEEPRLYFNFRTKLNDVWANKELQEKYRYEAIYPDKEKTGLRVRF